MARFFLDDVFDFYAGLLFSRSRVEMTPASEEGRITPIG
jgi:hypothetical protein